MLCLRGDHVWQLAQLKNWLSLTSHAGNKAAAEPLHNLVGEVGIAGFSGENLSQTLGGGWTLEANPIG